MALFVVCNLVVFQPWDWDDSKLLVYWFLAVAIVVAAWLVRTWDRLRAPLARAALVGLTATLVLSGVLEDAGVVIANSHFQMLEPSEIQLAADVRAKTDPQALFVVGMENEDPIAILTGRRITSATRTGSGPRASRSRQGRTR